MTVLTLWRSRAAYLCSSISKLCQIPIFIFMLLTKTKVWPESSKSLVIKDNAFQIGLQSQYIATKDNLKDEFHSCT